MKKTLIPCCKATCNLCYVTFISNIGNIICEDSICSNSLVSFYSLKQHKKPNTKQEFLPFTAR